MPRIIIMLFFCIMLCSCNQNTQRAQGTADVGAVGEKLPITRAEVAKMLALSKFTMQDIDNMERTIKFKDTEVSDWYDKYINAAYNSGLISGTDEVSFSPESNLTLAQAQVLVKKLNTRGSFDLKYNEADKDKPISYKIWLEAFSRAVSDKVTSCDIFVYATDEECEELGDDYILCNGGLRGAEGIDLSPYRDKIINVVMKDTEILGIVKVVDSEPTLENAEITDCSARSITIRLNNAERKFDVDNAANIFNVGDKVDVSFAKDGRYNISLSSKL